MSKQSRTRREAARHAAQFDAAIRSSTARLLDSGALRRQSQPPAQSWSPAQLQQPGPLHAPALTPDELTHQVIRALIGGAHRDEFAATPMAAFGRWGEIVKLLFEAHAAAESAGGPNAGTDAVVRAYSAIVRVEDAFALLMTTDAPTKRVCFTMAELLTNDYPPPVFIVPGMIPIGLTAAAGRPKLGKSWLVQQLLIAAVTGGEFLGRRVPKIKVGYFALEDSENRIADRLKKQTQGMDVDLADAANAIFCTDCPPARAATRSCVQ
jgi:hypothetical protein